MIRRVVVVLCAVVLGGCTTEALPDRRDTPTEVRDVIDSLNTRIEQWYAAGQVDSLATVFAEDVWQMPPNSPPLVGRDSLRAFWAEATQWGTWDFDLETQQVVTADSLAVERGRYAIRYTAGPRSPLPSLEDRGNYVVLWRREADGQWRIVWDAPVSELPPAAPPPATATARTPGG